MQLWRQLRRPLLAAPGALLRPTRATHLLGGVLEDSPRSLAGQNAGPAEGRGLQGDTR